MATPDYKLCDCCGTSVKGSVLWIATDRRMDAAGSMDTEGEAFDLCQKCCVQVLSLVCQEQGYEFGRSVVEKIRHRKKV